MKTRIDYLKKVLRKNKLEAFLINNPSNFFYFTGVKLDTGFLLVTNSVVLVFVPDLLFAEAKCRIRNFLVVNLDKQEKIIEYVRRKHIKSLGVESSISINLWRQLKKELKGVNLILQNNISEQLRLRKDKKEIALIRKSACMAVKTWHHIKNWVKSGKEEWEIYNEITRFIIKQGKDWSIAFEPIVASGKKNTVFPHYRLRKRIVKKRDIVLVDFGCKYCGYRSDLTRMIFLGRIIKSHQSIYNLLGEARNRVLDKIRPGIECRILDNTAREVIKKGGYGKFFVHGLGHGVGIDVHELPYLNSRSKEVLTEGMVFTVEPGIYVPGVGGMRIEDMILVTKTGYEMLTEEKR
ncbi:aminopeptidase P family protein [bacterium]|nr:aminopeptidase P family protein [bacterium]